MGFSQYSASHTNYTFILLQPPYNFKRFLLIVFIRKSYIVRKEVIRKSLVLFIASIPIIYYNRQIEYREESFMKKQKQAANLLIGIIFTLFFISTSVIIVINSRFLYRMDVDFLHLSENSGYSKEVITRNYDVLIDYCSPFNDGELRFPDLPSSESALSHFAEVKVIFVAMYYIAVVTGILLIFIILQKRKKNEYRYLKTASLTCIILPAIVGIASMINFDKTFILFHKLVFSNDDWLFNPSTDPIILLLPEAFFMHCAIAIVLLVLIGSGLLYWFYRRRRNAL